MEPRSSLRFSGEPLVLLHPRNVEIVVCLRAFGVRVQPRKTRPGRPSSDLSGVDDLYGAACLCQVVSDRAPDNSGVCNQNVQCRRLRDRVQRDVQLRSAMAHLRRGWSRKDFIPRNPTTELSAPLVVLVGLAHVIASGWLCRSEASWSWPSEASLCSSKGAQG